MAITASYSQKQNSIIDEIKKANLHEGSITNFLVIMSTNRFFRTADDLANIVSEYPGIGRKETAKQLIELCEQRGLLKTKKAPNAPSSDKYYYQDNQCFEKFVESFPVKIKMMINDCRNSYNQSVCVEVLGLLSGREQDEYLNSSFHWRLREAQSEILLPMLNTAANETIIKILKDRASFGVKVKILLPDFNKVVKKIRNAQNDSTKKWIEELHGIKNIEIRRYNRIEDSSIYSSVIIDRKICRICVFDSKREKSSNGTLIEVKKSGYNLNLTEMLIDRFNEIWFHSVSIDSNIIINLLTNKHFWFITFLVLTIIIYLRTDMDSTVHEISLNIGFAIAGLLLGTLYKDGFKNIEKAYKKIMRKEEY